MADIDFRPLSPAPGKPAGEKGALDFRPIDLPKGGQPANLPKISNQDIRKAVQEASAYLPAVGSAAGMLATGFLPGIGLAAAGGAAGKLAEIGVKAATGEKPESAMSAAKEVGAAGLEYGGMEFGGRFIAKPVEYIAKRMFSPTRMMESAIKPKINLPIKKRLAISETALKEGIPASLEGYEHLTGEIDNLNKEIADKIKTKSPQIGDVIDPKRIARRLNALETFYAKQAAPEEDLKAIREVREQFLRKHSTEAPFTKIRPGVSTETGEPMMVPVGKGTTRVMEPMDLTAAQKEKQTTYTMQRKHYGELAGSARDEAEKNLAYALRREIASLFPEIQGLNARDSSMIALENELRRSVGRDRNKNLVGLIPAVLGAGGAVAGAISGNKKESAGLGLGGLTLSAALMALDSPELKTRLAIAIYRAGRTRAGQALTKFTPTRLLPRIGQFGLAYGQSEAEEDKQ